MKVNISKTELLSALTTTIKATSARASVPILSSILIDVTNDAISFYASDLETSIKTTVSGLVEEEGKVAVPGKILFDIVKSLPEASVKITVNNETLNITSNQVSFDIRTYNAEDFTKFPDIEGIESICISAKILDDMVKKVSRSVSKDETRAVLTGILTSIKDKSIKMVTTDSYRLSVIDKESEDVIADSFEALIPGKALSEVTQMTNKNDSVKITLSSNQIKFEFGTTVFITRRLEGNYPNYQQLIPKQFSVIATISHGEFIDAVKRVSLMAKNNTALKCAVSSENQTLTISSKSQDFGNAEESLMVKVEGDDCEISINHSYLLDGLSVIDSDFVTLEILESMKPGIIRAAEDNYLYLVMPVRS